MRWVKCGLFALLALVFVLVALVVGVLVALNTQAGQAFAVREINKFGKDYVHLSGLTGRFPADLNIASLSLKDPQGDWLNAQNIALHWSPLALLGEHVKVQSFTIERLDLVRLPVYPVRKAKASSKSSFLPLRAITINHFMVNQIIVGPDIAGQAMNLQATGHARLQDFTHATLALDITSRSSPAFYRLNGTLDPQRVELNLAVHEPEHGLLSHLSGLKTAPPVNMTLTLAGPRQKAALQGLVALGDAKLTLAGTLDLDPHALASDVTLTAPDLAAFGTLANTKLAGTLQVHLRASQNATTQQTQFAAQGLLTLQQTPAGLDALLTGQTKLTLAATLHKSDLSLTQLDILGPGFSLNAHGQLGQQALDITSTAMLPHVAALAPSLRGNLQLDSHISGPPQDLTATATLHGQLTTPNIPSGPFTLTLQAYNLPHAPHGSLTGTGALAGAPLALAANFSRTNEGASTLDLTTATWESLHAQAQLYLAPASKLPTGQALLRIGQLSDLNRFTPLGLRGQVNADFAYQKDQTLQASLTTQKLSMGSLLNDLNSHITLSGPLNALAMTLEARILRLHAYPAQLEADGTLNAPAQSFTLSHLTSSWHGLTAKLLEPASITTKPDVSVAHLNLALNRATLALNGTLFPTLNASAALKNLDLSIIRLFAPTLHAAGLVSANASLVGPLKAPNGTIEITGTGLRYLDGLPTASLNGSAKLMGQKADVNIALMAGPQARLSLRGSAPLAMTAPMNLTLTSNIALPVLNPLLRTAKLKLSGDMRATAHITGTPQAPAGRVSLTGSNLHDSVGPAAALAPADLTATADIRNKAAQLNMAVLAGQDIHLRLQGSAPLTKNGAMNLTLNGQVNLKALDPILAANGSLVRGMLTTDLHVRGTMAAPRGNGTLTLSDGSLLNIGSGLNLTKINARVVATDRLVSLQSLTATAGHGTLSGNGTVNLAGDMPVNLALNADHASPIISDLLTETLNGGLTLQGALKTGTTLAGTIDILKANINIPRSLPASVANLPIHYEGEAHPAAAQSAPPPPVQLNLVVRAQNQIFIRGEGLFAELGGRLKLAGTLANPEPTGGFTLVRGTFSLAGKTLQFNSGKIEFNGDGFIPTLDLEATTSTSNDGTASLIISGTATKPQINLTSSPPLPSDEILAQLLFAQSSTSLSPFQAASLAAALAQIAGVGGGFSPLDSARNALGLDQLSLEDTGHGAPSIQAGRYIAPGVYVGASQSTTGEGTKATVEINLYKGLKLQSSTGTDSTGQSSSSVGLSYQFNY